MSFKITDHPIPGWFRTRDGRKAWVGCDLRNGNIKDELWWKVFPGVNPDGDVVGWDYRGHAFSEKSGQESRFDLIDVWREPEKVKLWINVYASGEISTFYETFAYKSREAADCAAIGLDRRLACVEIEVERGQGLNKE